MALHKTLQIFRKFGIVLSLNLTLVTIYFVAGLLRPAGEDSVLDIFATGVFYSGLWLMIIYSVRANFRDSLVVALSQLFVGASLIMVATLSVGKMDFTFYLEILNRNLWPSCAGLIILTPFISLAMRFDAKQKAELGKDDTLS